MYNERIERATGCYAGGTASDRALARFASKCKVRTVPGLYSFILCIGTSCSVISHVLLHYLLHQVSQPKWVVNATASCPNVVTRSNSSFLSVLFKAQEVFQVYTLTPRAPLQRSSKNFSLYIPDVSFIISTQIGLVYNIWCQWRNEGSPYSDNSFFQISSGYWPTLCVSHVL